jgi:D-glycero-beta-D-manno-heptose-7-phosphate kinase
MKRTKKQANSSAVDLRALAEFVERFEGKRIVAVGDFVADYFQYGEISRVSREAPVLILRHRETHVVPGGGANAAHNFAALGARVLPVSVVGDDEAGESMMHSFREKKVDVSGILRVKGRVTPTKMRFLAGWTHTVGQQVLRVDYEPQSPLEESERKRIEQKLASRMKNADALAISDYGLGVVSPEMVRRAVGKRRDLPVSVDSRYRLLSYAGAGITTATPNEPEVEALYHTTIGRNTAELERCGRATLKVLKLSSLVVTRGKDGMALFQPGLPTSHIAVHGSDQAVDVTGAGDTVLAAYTLGLAAGASPLEAAHIANIAGGLVVMKRGTATVSRSELLEAIHDAASEVPS